MCSGVMRWLSPQMYTETFKQSHLALTQQSEDEKEMHLYTMNLFCK